MEDKKEKNEKKEQEYLQKAELTVRKSNSFIRAKYKSSLLENQLTSLGLTRMEINNGIPEAKFYASEIKELLGINTNDRNIYTKLARVSKNMPGHVMFVEDGKGNFKSFATITNADYINGVYTITYNRELTPFISQLQEKGKYTSYSLVNTLQMKCDYTFRLYELFKMEAYKIDKSIPNDVVIAEYGVNELKAMIGIINTDLASVREARNQGKSWDWIVENIDTERLFDDWSNFKRRVLERARKEMRELTDIKFDYTLIKGGAGGKIRRIRFYISLNDPDDAVIENLEKTARAVNKNIKYKQYNIEDYEIPEPLNSYIGHNDLSERNIRMFYEVSDFNINRVIEAIALADKQRGHIQNYVGWIRSCIVEDYEKTNIETMEGSAEQAKKINEIVKEMEQSKKNPDVQDKIWRKMQSKEDYKEFLDYLSFKIGVTEEVLETAYSSDEKIDIYTKWKRGETDLF